MIRIKTKLYNIKSGKDIINLTNRDSSIITLLLIGKKKLSYINKTFTNLN